jgi:hypothetical protein
MFNTAIADIVVPHNSSALNITIYNNDRAFIRDKRSVQAFKGQHNIIYQGIPHSVITQSVIPQFDNEVQLFSQNYIYNTISLDSLLKNSIDTPVQYYTNTLEHPELRTGTLLAINPIVVQDSSGSIITLNSGSQIVFDAIPKGMITKPSLVWNANIANGGMLGIDLKYLTKNISWSSDYVLNLQNNILNLKGWITIKNDSGADYNNAHISVIAGDINLARSPVKMRAYASHIATADSITSESLSGYHLYTIPFTESIKNKQQKQITFIDKKNINYTQYGVNNNQSFHNYGTQKIKFNNVIEFQNTADNNLGIAIPKGVVRMYQNSRNGTTHFIGESALDNTPRNETITLTIGTLFDVVGEKRITHYKHTKHYKNTQTQYTLRNQGDTNITLKLIERIPQYGENISLSTSCDNQCSVNTIDAFSREFVITLNAGATYTLDSGFEVRL